MAEPVIHIVGIPVRVGTLLRQRCAWCGTFLIDEDISLWASSDGGGFTTWPVGRLLEVGDGFKSIVGNWPSEQLPVRCCASQAQAFYCSEGGR